MAKAIPTQTKAEKAAIILANNATDLANAFYEYHKEVIDEYNRLHKEATSLRHMVSMIKVNRINRGDFDRPF